ncbi:pectin acetylesterase 5-like isoform X2 [Tasmannia lanceolata]|uniref:pectin acetylesterase 5-like isoform X2 n=1 Tax=Tasmannia lanceolata TaxID=3420 RepID=UPI004063FCBD
MPNPRLRSSVWWRKWGKEIAIGAAGFTIFLLALKSTSWKKESDLDLNRVSIQSDPALIDLTLLPNAKDRGAVCLDGSPPGYHLQKGFGSGSNSWLLHIEGGGWCDTLASCSSRKVTALGSSDHMDHQVSFSGILSDGKSQNPDFFNWNKVKIRYCDGASLAGNMENEAQNGTTLFFKGQLIWEAIMDELLSVGLANARQALLSGCSAGGLATLIHCDDFRELLPKGATVKCLADAAFFLDEKDVSGKPSMRSFYHDVVAIQGVAKSLHKDCILRMESSQVIKNIKTPLFLVNPAYDFWQIQNVLAPSSSDPHHYWLKCKLNIQNCDPSQIEILQGFRTALLNALSDFQHNKDGGMFINSCFIHCQTWMANTWHSPKSPRIGNKTIAEAVGDWFFDRRAVKEIDCPYPCNPTCYNMVFG